MVAKNGRFHRYFLMKSDMTKPMMYQLVRFWKLILPRASTNSGSYLLPRINEWLRVDGDVGASSFDVDICFCS
jgi:hypothetical protein